MPKASTTSKMGRVNLVAEQALIDRWTERAKSRGLSLSAWIRLVCQLDLEAADEAKKGAK